MVATEYFPRVSRTNERIYFDSREDFKEYLLKKLYDLKKTNSLSHEDILKHIEDFEKIKKIDSKEDFKKYLLKKLYDQKKTNPLSDEDIRKHIENFDK